MNTTQGLSALLVALLSSLAPPQTSWIDEGAPGDHAMAFSPALQQVLRFGGRTASGALVPGTWLAAPTGTSWSRAALSVEPPLRSHHRLVHMDHLGETFLFGGRGENGLRDDLWAWNGSTWRAVPVSGARPTAREDFGFAYDPMRRVAVLFGGETPSGASSETWEFDGTTWTLVPTTAAPTGASRQDRAMAYSPATGAVTLYIDGATVWEWDGATWSARTASITMLQPGAIGHELVTDPLGRGVLLVGGDDILIGTQNPGAFALWDGSSWTPLPGAAATARAQHAAVATAIGVIVHGGEQRFESDQIRTEVTFAWDGSRWTETRIAPRGRTRGQLVFDQARQQLLLLGGREGFFPIDAPAALTSQGWVDLPAGGPSAIDMAIAYDAGRARVVVFGGCTFEIGTCDSPIATTWEWDGTAWSQRSPSTSPPARGWAAMAYDPTSARTVLFGGLDGQGTALLDTWTWDGTNWTALASATGPTGTGPMTFDPEADRVVMAEGGQLWRLENGTWLATPTPFTGARALGYDARRGVLVASGLGGIWERDAAGQWAQRPTSSFVPPIQGAFDPRSGSLATWNRGGLVRYAPEVVASWILAGPGCAVSGASLPAGLEPQTSPTIGRSWNVDLVRVPAATPALGCVGFDDATWNGQPLPADLTNYGLPGCTLYQDVAFYDALNGPGTWSLNVPLQSALVGLDVFLQALVIAPGANPAGAVVSDAVRASLGSH